MLYKIRGEPTGHPWGRLVWCGPNDLLEVQFRSLSLLGRFRRLWLLRSLKRLRDLLLEILVSLPQMLVLPVERLDTHLGSLLLLLEFTNEGRSVLDLNQERTHILEDR